MKRSVLLSAVLAAALSAPGAAADDSWLLAPYLADRAELLRIFGDDDGIGVVQVAENGPEALPALTPRYAGFEALLDHPQRAAEPDLRDAVAERAAPEPVGWLVVTRRKGVERRPLFSKREFAAWAALAEAQRRAYERLLRERRSEGLELVDSPRKAAGRGRTTR